MKPGDKLRNLTTGIDVYYAGECRDGRIIVKLPNGNSVPANPANYVRLTTRGTVPLKVGRKPAYRHDPAIVEHWVRVTGLSERDVVNELNAIRREGAV